MQPPRVRAVPNIRCLVHLALVQILAWLPSVAGEAPRHVKVEMASDEFFAGEVPRIRVTASAPGQPFVKQSRVHATAALYTELWKDGKVRVPPLIPNERRRPRVTVDDCQRLKPGTPVVMELKVLSLAREQGTYVVKVAFTPTPDLDWTIRKTLSFRSVSVPADRVRDRVTLVVPVGLPPGAPKERLDLMNVETKGQFQLLYRRGGVDGIAKHLDRVCPLARDSKLTAVPKFFERAERSQEIWVVFNREGELRFLRIEYVTGKVLEDRTLGPRRQGEF